MDTKILIVEDDIHINKGLLIALDNINSSITSCFSIKEAKEFLNNNPDIILLDLNLPDGDGLDFIKYIRKKSKALIIIISAKNDESTMVLGLRLGADDYITKPFSLIVIKEKINNLINRLNNEVSKVYKDEHLYFDFNKLIFKVDMKNIHLSNTEIKLLNILISNKNHIVTKNTLIEKIWQYDYIDENSLSVSINRLRNKIKYKYHIVNEYGVGYIWK